MTSLREFREELFARIDCAQQELGYVYLLVLVPSSMPSLLQYVGQVLAY